MSTATGDGHAATAHFLSRYSQCNLARQLPPMFNLVITNVPGSPVSLYLDGARMRTFSGMVGVFDGMALSLVVLSHGDTLSIAMTSAPEALRDPQRLADDLAESLDELEGPCGRPGRHPARGWRCRRAALRPERRKKDRAIASPLWDSDLITITTRSP